jgi:hypothetical protein
LEDFFEMKVGDEDCGCGSCETRAYCIEADGYNACRQELLNRIKKYENNK